MGRQSFILYKYEIETALSRFRAQVADSIFNDNRYVIIDFVQRWNCGMITLIVDASYS